MRYTGTLLPWAIALSVASGQSALIREGDPYPPGPAGQIYSSFNVTAINGDVGYACTFTAAGPGGFIQGVWGNLSGGPGSILHEQTTIASLTQTSIEASFGISGLDIAYSATVTDAAGTPNLDSLWLDTQLIALDNQQAPNASDFLTFTSRPGITGAGVPYYLAGLSDTSGGPSTGRALYLGTNRLYETGDTVPNLPAPLAMSAVDFDFRFSSDGSHHITPLAVNLPQTEDAVMAVDGVGLMLGGALVREAQAVPPLLGGPPESWQRFDFCGIADSGDYMFTGDTTGLVDDDEFIVRNGAFWARESGMLGGHQVVGQIESATLSSTGEIAFVWSIADPAQGNIEALFHESTLLLKEGDPVDWDGDGALDTNTAIVDFSGIDPITLTPAGLLYFVADVDVSGEVLNGYFSIEVERIGMNYCMANPNSTGAAASISAQGSASTATNQFFVTATDLPPFAFGFFIVAATQGFAMNPGGSAGNLCLGGAIGRYQNIAQNSGAQGAISIQPDLASIPQPLGPAATSPGDTWNFQAWFRDQLPGGPPTSNFTNGLEVTFL